MLDHRPFVFLDIETTGASARFARITEIGALRVERGKVVATYSQLINPEQAIPAFITNMTGISNDMVWKAPTFKAVAHELESFLDGALFIAHNVGFDYGFIKEEFARIGNEFSMDRMCSVKLSKRLYPQHRSHALDRIIERLNIEVVNRHRALDDAEVIYKFFQNELQTHGAHLFTHIDAVTTRSRLTTARSKQ